MADAAILAGFHGFHGQGIVLVRASLLFLKNPVMTILAFIAGIGMFFMAEQNWRQFFGVFEKDVASVCFRACRGRWRQKKRQSVNGENEKDDNVVFPHISASPKFVRTSFPFLFSITTRLYLQCFY